MVPVMLNNADFRRVHDACHHAGLIWNELVSFQRAFWEQNHADPGWKAFYAHLDTLDPAIRGMHSQTQQAIVADLEDAVATYRKNKAQRIKSRAPWRQKQYRPLSFTTQGWRVAADGRLFLSMGRTRKPILLPLPAITDPTTGDDVASSLWGEIRLCWDRQARSFSLHIAVPTKRPPKLDPSKTIAIDPGIINPMTLAVQTDTGFAVTVINGRAARAIKHRRNTAVAALTSKMSKATKDSNRWRKLDRARKRANAKAASSLRNIDHQVTRRAANMAITHDTGDIAVGMCAVSNSAPGRRRNAGSGDTSAAGSRNGPAAPRKPIWPRKPTPPCVMWTSTTHPRPVPRASHATGPPAGTTDATSAGSPATVTLWAPSTF